MYRLREGRVEVLLAHPGGPLWAGKGDGAWTLPKGEIDPGEDELSAARREFAEETGIRPVGRFERLAPVRQKGGKVVHAWTFESDCDPARIRSNTFSLEWPPRSGRIREFPEIDRAEFFSIERARQKINPAQAPWLDELERLCGATSAASRGR